VRLPDVTRLALDKGFGELGSLGATVCSLGSSDDLKSKVVQRVERVENPNVAGFCTQGTVSADSFIPTFTTWFQPAACPMRATGSPPSNSSTASSSTSCPSASSRKRAKACKGAATRAARVYGCRDAPPKAVMVVGYAQRGDEMATMDEQVDETRRHNCSRGVVGYVGELRIDGTLDG